MNTEEKAKAYDEAKKVIKDNLDALNEITETGAEVVNIQSIKNCFYRAFSELRESEDEQIRKEIEQLIQCMHDADPRKERWIAWLEKQKEYESTDFEYVWDRTDCGDLTSALDKYSEEAIINMCHAWYDKGIELERKSWLEKQGEHKRFRDCIQIGDKVTRNEAGELVNISQLERIAKPRRVKHADKVEQKSQRMVSAEAKEALYDKPAWSEEDMKEALRTEYEKGRADTIAEMKKDYSEEDERIRQCLIRDQEKALDDVRNDKYGHSEIISDLKEMYHERIDWLEQLKQRMGG